MLGLLKSFFKISRCHLVPQPHWREKRIEDSWRSCKRARRYFRYRHRQAIGDSDDPLRSRGSGKLPRSVSRLAASASVSGLTRNVWVSGSKGHCGVPCVNWRIEDSLEGIHFLLMFMEFSSGYKRALASRPNPSFHRTCAKSRAVRWIQTLGGTLKEESQQPWKT